MPTTDASDRCLFRHRYRVYWEDTDGGGVVYHARYLHFFERARSDWLRVLGTLQSTLKGQGNRVFAVRRMAVAYLAPARLDDELEVTVGVEQVRAASLRLGQAMTLAGTERVLATADTDVACLTADTFRPARIPAELGAGIRAWLRENNQ